MENILKCVGLLALSNLFMTLAWYGHLKYKEAGLATVIVVSWLIAFFEYCLQVPANRIGASVLSTTQLKTIQEILTLVVFVAFNYFYFGERLKWNHLVGFSFLLVGAYFIFRK